MVKRVTKPHAGFGAFSRRDVLRIAGASLPVAVLGSGLLLRATNAVAATAFDYYISPTGSDSNAGTSTSPWAITALNTKQSVYSGKRVGLLDGTYNVGGMMSNNRDAPALVINGGSAGAPTVVAAVNPRRAVITANSGGYGGGNNTCAMLGHKSVCAQQGYITIDGLKLTGGSYQIIEIGNYDFSGPVVSGVVIQNCEFTGNDCSQTSRAVGGNCAQISLYKNSGTVLRNNYHHDNVGMFGAGSADHFSALYQWQSSGTTVEYCTLVNTGNLHGKEIGNQGTTIRNCYIDVTPFTSGQNRSGIQGFDGAPTAGLTQRSAFHNNIIVFSYCAIDAQSELGNGGWTTPLDVYNNTFVAKSGWSTGAVFYEGSAATRLVSFYNNLFSDGGSAPGGYGYFLSNIDAFRLANYNVYGGHALWSTVPPGQPNSTGSVAYSSLAAWKAAISGDANSQSTAISFVSAGALSLQYQTGSGVTYQTGRVGGVSGGTAVNVGAWDGVVRQIGFFASSVTPEAPVITVS